MFLAIALVYILYLRAPKNNKYPNGFNRKFKALSVIIVDSTCIKGKPFYKLLDCSNDKLYLSHLHPGLIISLDFKSQKFITDTLINLRIPEFHTHYDLHIEYPKAILCLGNYRTIYVADLSKKKVQDSIQIPYVFIRSAPLANNYIALRAFDNNTGNSTPREIFLKLSMETKLYQKDSLSTIPRDPVSADGLLFYDAKTKSIVYGYFYKSFSLLLDTNLNQKMNIHALDTTNDNITTGGTYFNSKSAATYTNNTPRYTLNSQFSVYNGLLFAVSNLKADNESQFDFEINKTIDVYDLSQGKYIYSFHLPNPNKDRLKDILGYKDGLIAMYSTYIIRYSFR